jgi:L-arabinose isomerase
MFKIGLFGIGLETYWHQYNGLYERLCGYQTQINEKMSSFGCEIIDAGLVDNPLKAREVAEKLKKEDVSLIFLYVSTYALSSTVLPVVQHTKVPVIVLNLQPSKAIDYTWFNSLNDRTAMTGEWLANCQACSVPEIANVFNRSQIQFFQISGYLDDPLAWKEISEWIAASRVKDIMRINRMGFLGHFYCGMLDVYSDFTQQSIFFGNHIQMLEMCELKALRDTVSEDEIILKIAEIYKQFNVMSDCPADEIRRAAHTAIALDKLVAKYNLGSMAYYYDGVAGNDYENIITSIIVGSSLLTARHIPVAGEADVKNVQAMKILDAFGAGGSFTEFYLMDYEKDEILLGHDGPGHIVIAEGKPVLKPLREYHGKSGKGISVEMKVKNGKVTLLSVVQTFDGKLKLLVAEAESIHGPILEIGNTNSRYKFPIGIRNFVNEWCKAGPAHHLAIGIGHIASKIHKLGALLNIEVIQIS